MMSSQERVIRAARQRRQQTLFRRPVVKRYKLMIPGPVDVPDEVLEMMATPCMPHYGKDWLQIYDETVDYLKRVFRTKNDLFIIPGPGSATLEAAVSSLLVEGEKALVLVNGFFGQRLDVIARACGIQTRLVEVPWGEPILPEQVQQALDADPEIKAVVIVHHETSTGVLSPLEEIVKVTHARGLPVVVDAISTIGGIPLPVDEWEIECCITVANKCLETPPGLGMVSVSERAWQIIASKADKRCGWYLNLNVWRSYAREWDWHPYPATVPTNIIVALHKSLEQLLEEGLEARYARYVAASQMVRAGLREMGFEFLVPDAYSCPLVTVFKGKPDLPADELAQFLREEHGILVAGGIGPLQGKIVRVGHMGKAASESYSQAFLAAVREFVKRKSAQR